MREEQKVFYSNLDLSDLDLVQKISNGAVDLTFGSALDIFGGSGLKLSDAAAWNAKNNFLVDPNRQY
jgi:hypothetical protein